MKVGIDRLNDPFLNKGTAFTTAEREQFKLTGLLPPRMQTLTQQIHRMYDQVERQSDDLAKRQFLMNLFNTNRVLFFALFADHVEEFMPIVYDPTIAESIEHYSDLYLNPQNAAFLSIDDDPKTFQSTLERAADGREIKLVVVTDAEGILGIGDWGTNGVDIAIGKLMVYTAAAGIDPRQVLPVMLDAGTNNAALLKDAHYLGNQHARVEGDRYAKFVDDFVTAATTAFPDLYLHWEDFGRGHAAKILQRYQGRLATFNDDIQGTGIISLAAILGALNISGQKLTEQTYLTFGAGSAGAGIAHQIFAAMVTAGLSPDEARQHFYMVDKQGLLFDDMPDLTPEQRPFARRRAEFANAAALTSLAAVVATIHPTIMVGTSTQPGTFTEAIVRDMAAHTPRPIILPLSNPTKLAEATAEDLLKWTDGRALVATGVPSAPIKVNGVTYQIGQANNALVYPGLGLGVLAVAANRLDEPMISAAAHSLGGLVDVHQAGAAVLPPVDQLSHFSRTVATAVAQSALDRGLATKAVSDAKAAVRAAQWQPVYDD
ncbi:malolactic enzyme [Levilactobacillus tangyuanensis]|uniref:Malolactic enzyme n=1 Tax=Levilactobacillus tangyuanensis TaxID=2486021 RepID=A0ABW1TJP7_9LACO|nr:malolactic enzyme [Levilactobacillus tangyuanensis]